MNLEGRIVIDPEVLCGKPIVKGRRLAVEFIVDLLAQGWGEADILRLSSNPESEIRNLQSSAPWRAYS